MNCKECYYKDYKECPNWGICPQVDELEEIKSKIEASKVKHYSSTRKARTACHARHARMARDSRKKMTQAAREILSFSKLITAYGTLHEIMSILMVPQRRTDNDTTNYYLDETKFCLTVTNFCFAKCGNRIKIGERLPQVHIKMTRRQPLQIKSGRGRNCESCAYFDWWNGECMKDDECKNDEILANAHKAADFNAFPFSRLFRKLHKQLSGKTLQIVLLLRRAALRAQGHEAQSRQRIAYALKLQPHRGAKRIKH